MARYCSSRRLTLSAATFLAVGFVSAQFTAAQYTWVQDPDSVGDWHDSANWLDGGTNTTFPNGVGVTAQINQPIKSGFADYTLDMPTADVTVGQLTIDNTGDFYGTKLIMVNHAPGRLIFEDSSGTAKYIETANGTAGDAPGGIQNSIQVLIQLNSDLEITQNNYPNLNTGTTFTNRIDGDSTRKIIKKGIGGIQFNLNVAPPLGAGQGFFGQIMIEEGAIRFINKSTFLSTVSGITVSDGGQLQLADNATAVPDYAMAEGAVLNLNGLGKSHPQAGPEGALRFGITVAGRTQTFHNPVNLQSDARIHVALANTTGLLNKVVSGSGDLIKSGAGQLTLTDNNTYTGDTRINNGILSITNPYLADGADVYLTTSGVFNLDFGATDTIRSLYFDGIGQSVGTWGGVGSGATNESAFFTGTGLLNVTTLPSVGVPGDYNGNGAVDAADYVLWRNGGPLQNEVDNAGVVDAQDYVEWNARFGNTSGSGSGSLSTSSAVPEPTAFMLVFLAIATLAGVRRNR